MTMITPDMPFFVETGYNGSGQWRKTYSAGGVLLEVSQSGSRTIGHGGTITLPVSMPDLNYTAHPISSVWGNMASVGAAALAIGGFSVALATHNGANGGSQLVRWSAVWHKQ